MGPGVGSGSSASPGGGSGPGLLTGTNMGSAVGSGSGASPGGGSGSNLPTGSGTGPGFAPGLAAGRVLRQAEARGLLCLLAVARGRVLRLGLAVGRGPSPGKGSGQFPYWQRHWAGFCWAGQWVECIARRRVGPSLPSGAHGIQSRGERAGVELNAGIAYWRELHCVGRAVECVRFRP